MITGFTFTRNSVTKGEPFVEAILQVKPFVNEILVVDIESTDNTRDVLYDLGVTVITATNNPDRVFELHQRAKFENIIQFYPNEIYSIPLLKEIKTLIASCSIRDISVLRLVIEQNFQRIRWYPEFVHRVFRRGNVIKKGLSTNKEHLKRMVRIGPASDYLWACHYCFRENWADQFSLEEDICTRLVPNHFIGDNHFNNITNVCKAPHWKYKSTPFRIPTILNKHVGVSKYNPYLNQGG